MHLNDVIAEHATSVFLNLDHFAEPFVFQSNAAADIPFDGICDKASLTQRDNDEANSELADAHLVVSVETVSLLKEAVSDFAQDGWIVIDGQRYSITGEVDRDSAMVTLALSTSNVKRVRKVK